MNYYVFDTLEEEIEAQAADYSDFIASLPTEKEVSDGEGGTIIIPIDNTAYVSDTKRWAEESQRATDGKYVYPVCPASTAVGRIIEALDTGGIWFPEPEE